MELNYRDDLRVKAKLKDKIVRHCILNIPGENTIRKISDSIDIQYDLTHSLTTEIIKDGYIGKVADVASKDSYSDSEMIVIIKPLGRLFSDEGGGYSQKVELEILELDNEKEERELKIEKLKYDVKNSKRIFKTYWFTFIFACISFGFVIFQIVLKLIQFSKP